MGISSSCQEEWCVKPAEMHCDCVKKSFCSNCFSKHMSKASKTFHNAYSIIQNAGELFYKQLKYVKSDHSTEVYEGLLRATSVIIKVQYFTSKSDLNRKQEEAAIQRSSKHPNICKCLKSYIDETYTSGFKFVMVMEKALRDLDQEIVDRVEKSYFWVEDDIISYIIKLVDALSFMQQNNLTHRDIKPANILVFSNNLLKLADFGLSIQEEEIFNTKSLGVVGTVLYLSPKLMKAYDDVQKGKNLTGLVEHNPYKSDVYSLGLTILYMASLKEPCGLNFNIEGTTYLQNRVQRAIQQIPYSQDLKMILSAMLETEENSRMDFLQLKKYLKNEPEPLTLSFGVSDISANEVNRVSETINTNKTSTLTLSQIINDPLLPIPIKLAINSISSSKSMILAHTILPVEADYIRFALIGSNIITLDLGDCNLGHKGLEVIIETDLSTIENLSLGNNNLGKRGAKILMNNMQRL